jgi:hypothetical protein
VITTARRRRRRRRLGFGLDGLRVQLIESHLVAGDLSPRDEIGLAID